MSYALLQHYSSLTPSLPGFARAAHKYNWDLSTTPNHGHKHDHGLVQTVVPHLHLCGLFLRQTQTFTRRTLKAQLFLLISDVAPAAAAVAMVYFAASW